MLETIELPSGYALSTGHRDIACSPEGLVAIVCPVEKYAKEFKLINLESLQFHDEFDIDFRAYGVQFPVKASPVEENCKDAHIQLWEAGKVKCLCNDGYTASGSGDEVKCSPDETYETVQSYCYPNQFKCSRFGSTCK